MEPNKPLLTPEQAQAFLKKIVEQQPPLIPRWTFMGTWNVTEQPTQWAGSLGARRRR